MAEPLDVLLCPPADWTQLDLRDWDRLLRLARQTNLIARLALWVGPQMDAVPERPRNHLIAALRLAEHQRQAITWECGHIERALRVLQAPRVLLKGAAYVMAGQTAAHGRLFGDVDLLMPRSALYEAESLLAQHGWSASDTGPYDQRYYREWMHELPPMIHLRRATVLDLHHNILPLSAPRVPDADQLLAASQVIEGSDGWRRLCLEDQILHSATHLFHEGELDNGLRDLYDLDALLREGATGPGFWQRLLSRAECLGLGWPLLLALRHTARALGTPVPAKVQSRARALGGLPGWRLAWLDWVYAQAFRPALPEDERWSRRIACGLLYLRAHVLRMPIHLLLLHLGRKAMLRLVKHSSREA